MNRIIRLAAVASLVAAAATAQAAVLDNFDRPDAETLGPNWTQVAGSSSIISGQATGTSLSMATFNGGTGNTVSFDIADVGTGTQYIAAVLGYGAGNNYFIKVQNNGYSEGFDTFGFYTGNNGSVYFSNLTSVFTTGHVQASFSGSIATLLITPTNGATQTYTYDYGYMPTGNGVGLGFYGAARADNFAAAVPEPETYAMLIAGLGLMGGIARRRKQK